MKKTFSKKLLIICSSLLAISSAIYGYGCADGWWGYSYYSSFAPEATTDSTYRPFFYAPDEKFYDYTQLEYIDRYNEDNITAWEKYLPKKLTRKEISYYLLNDTASERIDHLYQQILDKKEKSVSELPLSDKRIRNFITFLYYAKQIEFYSTNTYASWDYDDRIITPTDKDLVAQVENYYRSLKKEDSFYKNRIWFQVLKAKFYSNDQPSVLAFFEETADKQPKNELYYRALGYVAGTYYNLGEYDKSNYQFAVLFDKAASKRHEALYNFKPMSADSIEQLVQQTKDPNIQSSMLAMNGYYADEATAMKRIYALQPNSPHFDFLLTRWVNQQEANINDYEGLMSYGYGGTSTEKKQIDLETLNWLGELLKNPKKLHNPTLAYLAYGYLNIYTGEHELAKASFEKASKVGPDQPLLKAQIRLFNLINNVYQVHQVGTTEEKALLADLQWLYKEVPADAVLKPNFRYDYASQWIKKTLSTVYQQQGNPLMAELLNSQTGYYDDQEKGNAMEKFLLKTDKTDWEKLFAELYPYHLGDIYESRAIYAYYHNRVDEAIALMEKASTQVVKTDNGYGSEDIYYKDALLRGNPFNGKIQDCNDCDHAAPQKIKYSKISFLNKVKELQQNVAQNQDMYNNALLLGNAFYSTSYFGNARVFYYNNIINEYGNYIGSKNQPYLLGMDNAQHYYEMALKAANNDEQRAKVSYLLAKVERNNFYTNVYFRRDDYYWSEPEQTMFKEWKGFKALKEQYSNTDYYREVIQECGYFRSYLNR